MHVIIPLAGFGSRLRPHTYTKPKPLINVAGKPVLGHILDKLSLAGVRDVTFVTGYLGDQIADYVWKSYPQIRGRYVEQKELNGQASAILLARNHCKGPAFIVFVDTIADADLNVLNNLDCDGMIYVKEVEDPRRFGVVKLDSSSYITEFVEKPNDVSNKLVVIGMYFVKDCEMLMECCSELIRRDIKTKGEFFLADAFNLMIAKGAKLRAQKVDIWLDAGKPETVLETNRYLLRHEHDNSADWSNNKDIVIVPPVNIHPSAKIERSVIGPNATIAENCQIVNSVVRESIVDTGAQVVDHVLANSLIGRDAVLIGRPRRFNVGDSSVVGFDEE